MRIRKMTPQDVNRVALIEAECFSQPWSAKGYLDTISQDYALALVSETDDSEIVGMCMLVNAGGDGDVSNVAVTRDYRKQGIAYQMLQELFSQGKAMGVEAFTLEVRASNSSAISLYEKCGFLTEGVRKNFYDNPREDALIMWKR